MEVFPLVLRTTVKSSMPALWRFLALKHISASTPVFGMSSHDKTIVYYSSVNTF